MGGGLRNSLLGERDMEKLIEALPTSPTRKMERNTKWLKGYFW